MNVTIPLDHIAAFIDSLLNGEVPVDEKQHAFVLVVALDVEGMNATKAIIMSNMDKLNADAILMQAVAATVSDTITKEH